VAGRHDRRPRVTARHERQGAIVPGAKVHACGYCLGGTLLAIAAARMAQDGDHRLATLTLLAAQTDFSEAGELTLFVDEGQLAYLEDLMWDQGYLDAGQMAGAFALLRADDLVWSRLVRQYLLGEREAGDGPDGLERGRHAHAGPDARRVPALAVPWEPPLARALRDRRPAGGADRHPRADLRGRDRARPRRALGVGLQGPAARGHRGHLRAGERRPQRRDRERARASGPALPDQDDGRRRALPPPEVWAAEGPVREGSWWPAWAAWLAAASGPPGPPPRQGAPERGLPPLMSAPGSYVLEP
jgi:poly[(R)-3-hydroxyalkanoate] polymerase subunit PhaC